MRIQKYIGRIVGSLGFAFLFSMMIGSSEVQANTVLVDLGNSSSFRGVDVPGPDSNGNHWTSVWSGDFYSNLVDKAGSPTTIDLGFSAAPGTDSFNGPAGATSNPPTPTEIAATDIDAFALGDLGGSKEAAIDFYVNSRFEIQGLDPMNTYDLTFFGSHKFSTDDATTYSVYTDNTYTTLVDSVTLNHQTPGSPFLHNRDTTATISGLSPQTSNILYVEFLGAGGNSGYLNALKIEEFAPPPTTTIQTFNDNFNLSSTYSSWDTATITPGTDALTVNSTNFGGGFAPIAANVDGTNTTHVELDVTVNQGDEPNVIVLLEDGDGTQHVFRWFSLDVGNHVLGFRLDTLTNANAAEAPNGVDQANSYPGNPGSVAGLDLSTLSFFQLQVDPPSAFPYDISYNNLRMFNRPGGFDTNKDVNGADFLAWARGISPDSQSSSDLGEFMSNFGATGEVTLLAAAVSVPEPATSIMLLAGISLLIFHRSN